MHQQLRFLYIKYSPLFLAKPNEILVKPWKFLGKVDQYLQLNVQNLFSNFEKFGNQG